MKRSRSFVWVAAALGCVAGLAGAPAHAAEPGLRIVESDRLVLPLVALGAGVETSFAALAGPANAALDGAGDPRDATASATEPVSATSPVPELQIWSAMAAGLGVMVFVARRRRNG